MPRILFIKQRVRRGPAIESDIEDLIEKAFRQTPGIILETYELGENIKRAEDCLKTATQQDIYNTRKAETERCLQTIHGQDVENVLLLNGYLLNHFNPDFFLNLRKCVKRIAAWQFDDPYYIDMTLSFIAHIDVVFTVDTVTMPVYKRYDKITEWLPLACSPGLHKIRNNITEQYQSDVCFIGVPFKGSRRVEIIDAIAPTLATCRARIIGATNIDTWQHALNNYDLINDKILDSFISTGEAINYYNGAAINLNLHKDSFGHVWDKNAHRLIAQSPCERTFSIAGCGAFQLIDSSRPDLDRLFDSGKNIVSFDDVNDLSRKIDYYLKHEDERRAIAMAAQEYVYRKHTYEQRIQRIIEVAFS